MREDELLGRLDLSGATQLTFGRDPSRVDVALDHSSISRHHATITFDRDTAYLSDIRSTHGTFIARSGDETRLDPKDLAKLEPGDVVRFGESSRRYVFCAATDDAVIILRVPNSSIGRLLGRGGATIAGVRQRTGARVEILPRDNRSHDRDDIRLVELKGHMTGVAAARIELLAITAGEPPPPLPTPGTTSTSGRFRYASTATSHDDVL